MDIQSSIEVISKIIEIVSEIQKILSGIDVKLWVGVLSLVGVLYTVHNTRKNVNNTNDLKKEMDEQTRKLTKELGEKNLKALEQRRYIDAISTERVKWINTMRDKFSEYVKISNIQMNDMNKLKHGKGDVDDSLMRERYYELTYIGNNVYFLLNPTEPVSKEIRKLQGTINRQLRRGNISEFNSVQMKELAQDLGYLFQVVLKSEWKRVKEENKKGEEIDDEKMEQIYKKAAQKIDNKKYNKYFNK
ncbi:hypothetical protein ILS93_00705 [Bacillus sp. 16GRE42]|uniref:hypothetical protein n=1 Tax=Bacillus sp. 16GRE42 TaxID=2778092 RepID=UPI001C9B6DDA|nr:hypothetical protein [Bacillus sp. 16GRE42]MBY7120648.1 hypothetical protein [Bacillus sp. 16GRE42]